MELWDIPAIDQHAHNLLKPEAIASRPYAAAFTEAHHPDIIDNHVCHTLFYRRSLRDMADLLKCKPQESEIIASRNNLGLEELTKVCFNAANLDAILLDDGFLPQEILPWQWHQQFVSVRRLLRIEDVAQNLISQVNSFEEFRERFRAEIDPPPPEVVGFKSIAAYRTGLEIKPVELAMVKDKFNQIKQTTGEQDLPTDNTITVIATQGSNLKSLETGNECVSPREQVPRLSDKSLIDFLIIQTLEVAAKHKIPIQFHTGFGDPDLDLRQANPLHLRFLLEDNRFRDVPIVLLHTSYPYTREAGYLASVYPNVYIGLGLAIPSLSMAGMRNIISQLMELAPVSKLMYSSDAHLIPDLYYLGAKWGRKVLGEVLDDAVKDADLTVKEAEEMAVAVLRGNSDRVYGLNV
ncbi:amidohydrolase family protein [Mastigocoleus sp. MO_188.B34]|uniref:amidohydrolase family protein n=1 Tax=Mastigocoleus sp. MO_188.B34 TaxID=3036635 RepID=UPI00262AD8BF|nr:amidohydrolase family protein [Mastigocoleus sp. MO_188.B34]MDJ0695388.1 amidohydrolase family protein [Mastigocoleus sp. MO_188.B34]